MHTPAALRASCHHSLQGEHGTGRNMAPFVELEWGRKAVGIMKEVKAAFDPVNLLNPGVILNDVSRAPTVDYGRRDWAQCCPILSIPRMHLAQLERIG